MTAAGTAWAGAPFPQDVSSKVRDETPPAWTIFVVEPDILVRMVVAEYLRECGFKVIEGATAKDVRTVLEAGRQVDVIFADVKLDGDMDGFALAKHVREKHARVDVILTSGTKNAANKASELCDEDGPLEKPYQPQEVVRRIQALLERRRRGGARRS
jgi:DNA-binding response OmpR family regulator